MFRTDFLIDIDSRQQSLKQDLFYIDGQHNTKLSVLKTDSQNTSTRKKSMRKYSPGSVLLIPTNDENESSRVRPERQPEACAERSFIPLQAWLRKHSLAQLKLDLHKMVSGPECKYANDRACEQLSQLPEEDRSCTFGYLSPCCQRCLMQVTRHTEIGLSD
jgi:hypothetical protein